MLCLFCLYFENIRLAENDAEAKELVDRMHFDLIVIDLNMLEVDGRDLLRYIPNESSQALVRCQW